MGKSQQLGWIVLKGKRWYGYYRKSVLDPETEEPRVSIVPVRLGLKSQVTKGAAHAALRDEIAKQTGQIGDGRVLKDGSVTFEWFVRNRYFPLRQGDWRPETAKEKKAQIEIDLVAKFGPQALDSIDKFELQTHVNHLAKTYCQDRVKQARSYLMSIFDEAIEQESLVRDPSRKLRIPKNLRPKDKRILTWDQLADVLKKATRRDRLIILLDMTEALRPSELFAIRWRTFDGDNTLDLTETIYRGVIRPFGKTPKSLGKMHLPDDLVTELNEWKLECKEASCRGSLCKNEAHRKCSPDDPMFPNADGGFIDTSNYRERVLKTSRGFCRYREAELSDHSPHDCNTGAESRFSQRYPVPPAALARRYHGQRIHAGTARERAANGRDGLCDAHRQRRLADSELSICYQMLPITNPQSL